MVSGSENISHADAKAFLLVKNKNLELLVDDKVVVGLAKMYGVGIWNIWAMLLK